MDAGHAEGETHVDAAAADAQSNDIDQSTSEAPSTATTGVLAPGVEQEGEEIDRDAVTENGETALDIASGHRAAEGGDGKIESEPAEQQMPDLSNSVTIKAEANEAETETLPEAAAAPSAPSVQDETDHTDAPAADPSGVTASASDAAGAKIPDAELSGGAATSDQKTSIKQSDDAATFLRETFDSFARNSKAAATANNPLGHVESLRKRIERDRRDGEAWLGLIDDAMQRADLQELRNTYEEFFTVYPNAARQWQDYGAIELSHSEFSNVERIFTRCLRTTPSTDLWRFYLSYTRRVNPLPPVGKPGSTEEADRERVRKVIEGAYEFALRFIGHSRDAGDVWRDYIALLKEREAGNQWQAGQKMDQIRNAYQRAVAIPLANVETIWREYDAYENGLNRITAKRFLAERSPQYMTARSAFREMRTLTENLQRPNIPRVPCWAIAPSLEPVVSPLTIVRDRHSVESWKKYLRWEESNPLQIEDVSVVQARVLMAYRKASMHMRFYAEVWFMASDFLRRCGREEEAISWLKNGMDACLGSPLLTFAYIEDAESQGQTQDCGEKLTILLDWFNMELDLMHSNLEDKIKMIDSEAEGMKAEIAARKRDEGAADMIEGEEREEMRRIEEHLEQRRIAERERVRPKIEEQKEFASLVWIKYMHFARRTEGQRPSRAIFARARKSKYCTWQVFEANALQEFHCSKDVSVATKVFELALKTYGSDEAFVTRYLDFLLSINDVNNAGALFERTVSNFTPERARPIWDRWSAYIFSFGDSASIANLKQRLDGIYSDVTAAKQLTDRNSYMDLDVVGSRDLGMRAAAAGGGSAAERAVNASREMAHESVSANGAGSYAGLSSLPEEGIGGGTGAEPPLGPSTKRPRFGRDGVSPTPPPPASRPIPTGPRGTKRSVSPPSRYVPPPRSDPQAQPPVQQQLQQQQGPAYLEMPDGLLFFLEALPATHLFDGPRFGAEDIVECLMQSSIPAADWNNMARGGFRRRGGFARGGRRF